MKFWYRPLRWFDAIVILLLAPLMFIYAGLTSIRRAQYKAGQRPICDSSAPVVVVGNITVGGTGKTPITLALVKALQLQGLKPAIISRGYGAHCVDFPRVVDVNDNAAEVGDEPLLLALRSNCPVLIDPERCRGIKFLNENFAPDVIVSDDGLQHYAMGRAFEIVVVDSVRGFGNGFLLPLGPLREPISRLESVDAVFHNGDEQQGFVLQPTAVVNVKSGERLDIKEFLMQKDLVAVAGIGNPRRFFQHLEHHGFNGESKAFADHHPYLESDFKFAGPRQILMTEKDAVKCRTFSISQRMWYVEVDAVWHNSHFDEVVERLCEKLGD
jgi:tetraacyldisaccharide 4'-kinase